jgi:hypothetical protein
MRLHEWFVTPDGERQSLTGRWMPVASGSTAQLRVEPCGLSREVVAFGEVGR